MKIDINQECIEKELNEMLADKKEIRLTHFYRKLYLQDYDFEDESFPERLERLIERIQKAGKCVMHKRALFVIMEKPELYKGHPVIEEFVENGFDNWFEELELMAKKLYDLDCNNKECWRCYYNDGYNPSETLHELYEYDKKLLLETMEGLMKQVFTIKVYLDDGRIFEYDVNSEASVREHSAAIAKGGYRHNDGSTFEHYPPHRILKIKCEGDVYTSYQDRQSGT